MRRTGIPEPPSKAAERRASGFAWERIAQAHLERAGLRAIAANCRYKVGELDLVMRDRDAVVFVEVRYRKGSQFGGGASSVDGIKQHKVVRAAQCFLLERPDLAQQACRFDVVAIEGDAQAPKIEWIKSAFEA